MMDRKQASSTGEPSEGRVLLVDDSAEGREALARYLTLQGFEVRATALGGEALEILRDAPQLDIVITDLVLPDGDGRQIAREAKLRTPPPLVMLITGWSSDSSIQNLEENGVDFLLFKPLDLRDLVRRIREALAGPATAP
jgi:DNA-binding response OmpR family regulator